MESFIIFTSAQAVFPPFIVAIIHFTYFTHKNMYFQKTPAPPPPPPVF